MTKIKKTFVPKGTTWTQSVRVKTIIDNPKLKEKFYFKTTNRKYPIKQLLLGLQSKPCRASPEHIFYLF